MCNSLNLENAVLDIATSPAALNGITNTVLGSASYSLI